MIHIKWSLQGNSKTKVSWKASDFLFGQSDQLTLLKTTSQITSGKRFIHQIDFTVIQPQHLVVKGLPVIVDGETVLTPSFDLDIKTSALPLQLNDFMPMTSVETNGLLLAWFYVLGILFFIGIIFIVSQGKFKLWYQKRKDLKERERILNQLFALELSANFENISTASLVRKVSELVQQYKRVGLVIPPENIDEQAAKLLFLPDAIAKIYYPDFFNEIKRCVHASQRLS
ncbi:hypothetical protein [Flavobacterium sp.]|uniref:hypothetical protein n=1 Tax=Flavobacterium sp. TaxID=239 RepID=UPI00286ACDF2|nr:hypothetical protein [Flavobacterium sp.]